jgi:hypothetical protein
MIGYGYSPFTDNKGNEIFLANLSFDDLQQLHDKNIEEGYQIEYKRELSPSVKKELTKKITSFANEKGGWLFVGISETDIGICPIQKENFEIDIHNRLTSTTSPVPKTYIKFLTPENDPDHGVLVIWVPEGSNPPYMANGKFFQRVGSSSTPIQQIADRYQLERLFKKSKENKRALQDFCKKEVSVHNYGIADFIGRKDERGMCNIYLIPTVNPRIMEHKNEEELAKYFIQESLIQREYSRGDLKISFNIPFETYSYTPDSLIFRNSKLIDRCESTLVWEQYFHGPAKFHLPIPYVENKNETIRDLKSVVKDFANEKIFEEFEYINGENFLMAVFGSIGLYCHCMHQLQKSFDELIIHIELENVRKNVLIFNSSKYVNNISENGLKFSDKSQYTINKNFEPIHIEKEDVVFYFGQLTNVINAFGVAFTDGVIGLFDSRTINHPMNSEKLK